MTKKETNHRWYMKNREKQYLYHKQWVSKNREKSRATWRKYYYTEKGQKAKKRQSHTQINRRNNLLNYFKTKPCADCQGFYNPWQMDFDHVRGVKKWAVGAGRLNSLKLVLEEIAKCEVVCSNCHRNRTQYRRSNKCN